VSVSNTWASAADTDPHRYRPAAAERRLLIAILEGAILDLSNRKHKKPGAKQQARDVLNWMTPGWTAPISFEFLCMCLHLDADRIRGHYLG
jgi:hypothetical protein